jgi:hypothetical protein
MGIPAIEQLTADGINVKHHVDLRRQDVRACYECLSDGPGTTI